MVLRRIPATVEAVADSTTASTPPPRVICLLCDGTGDMFDGDNSNVVKLFQALRKDDPRQLCYYQCGVGTYTSSAKSSLKTGFSAALDMAIGSSLGTHVKEAYQFLMQTYREGDKISVLGFSRGAYTARALCGMLTKVGLLPRHNIAQLPFAYDWYCDDSAYGWQMSADFKRTFSIDVNVHFLGCWDTVASVGVIPRILPLAKSDNSSVAFFRHALALDERRAKFKANHWYQRHPAKAKKGSTHVDSSGRESSYGVYGTFDLEGLYDNAEQGAPPAKTTKAQQSQQMSPSTTDPSSLATSNSSTTLRDANTAEDLGDSKRKVKKSQRQLNLIKEFKEKDAREWGRPPFQTDVEEVWFAGSHADVGGGAVPNSERHQASRIPLRWMIRETFKCNTGLLYRTDVLAEHGLDVETLYPKVLPRSEPAVGPSPNYLERHARGDLPTLDSRRSMVRGAHEDYFDSIASLNDQLKQAKVWWILELAWPIKYRIQDKETGIWRKKIGLNRGRYRTVRETEPKMHFSVRQRERWAKEGYRVKATADDEAIWQIVH
ncbi:hypothetical protein BDZ90DRAFT_248796 [Jaminaea rosea]|uniref:T6SS Phospholipase effector Tle1-like catalytic domain-containing protein n=1 Tax=Jaminaea rosea TaxID=1569628 RepID=A0A316V0R1_9BASI|nr:hypothetical protein BDZ90DRAFT_248796 [Jaminaea rosea]PWN31140.1 hypothetical protein BDZ90DRAFT_248796 [Jaminaea rosea]